MTMKNSIITILTVLALVFSTYLYAADDHSHDHKHEESDKHKKHHAEGDHEQHGDHVDHQEESTDDHNVEHDHGDHANEDANKKDRKSTRLNSSHVAISYAVFCLKKKDTKIIHNIMHKH